MVLNICDWIGERVMGVSVWVGVEVDAAGDEDGGEVEDVEDTVERAAANF